MSPEFERFQQGGVIFQSFPDQNRDGLQLNKLWDNYLLLGEVIL